MILFDLAGRHLNAWLGAGVDHLAGVGAGHGSHSPTTVMAVKANDAVEICINLT